MHFPHDNQGPNRAFLYHSTTFPAEAQQLGAFRAIGEVRPETSQKDRQILEGSAPGREIALSRVSWIQREAPEQEDFSGT